MHETGEVIAVTGDSVTVRMKRTTACTHCRACTFGAGASPDELRITAKNGCAARVHDRVRVELKPEAFYKAALILYGLPLIGLLIGFAIGETLGERLGLGAYAAWAGALCGLAMLGVAYGLIKSKEPLWRSKGYAPVASAVETDADIGDDSR